MSVLNTAYAQDKKRAFGPIFFAGEYYSFYINLNNPTTDSGFSSWELLLYSTESDVFINIPGATMTKDLVLASYYNVIIKIPAFPSVKFGLYQFVIRNRFTLNEIVRSSYFDVEEISKAPNVARVFYRHTRNKFGFNYEANPTFYNIITLPLIQIDYNIDTDRTQYRNITDRRVNNIKSYTDKIIKIESYNFDEQGHEAMAAIYEHDTVFINRKFIVAKDSYTVAARISSVLAKGSINVYVDDSIVNPNEALIPALDVYLDDIGNNKYL